MGMGKRRAPRRRIVFVLLAVSALLVIVSLGSLYKNGLEFGIDFTGGVLLEVGYEQPADLEAIRDNLAGAGFEDAQVQLFGRETDVLVGGLAVETAERLEEALGAQLRGVGDRIDVRVPEKRLSEALALVIDEGAEIISVTPHRVSLESVFLSAVEEGER